MCYSSCCFSSFSSCLNCSFTYSSYIYSSFPTSFFSSFSPSSWFPSYSSSRSYSSVDQRVNAVPFSFPPRPQVTCLLLASPSRPSDFTELSTNLASTRCVPEGAARHIHSYFI
ncbi:hypothetical protein E2C01_069089 [Portunus trituberculatus]|uniref:Uncharacterized protein n=1 Tax=Portunus trituberculatus TaxID=210409 RepID=A0A5B7HXZ1_PORTR|nr:hypothetical protein [Portunus trituberculatus]